VHWVVLAVLCGVSGIIQTLQIPLEGCDVMLPEKISLELMQDRDIKVMLTYKKGLVGMHLLMS